MRSHSWFILSITASNYEEAIAFFFLNNAPVTSKNDLKGLRKIFDLVEAHVRVYITGTWSLV